MSVPDYSAENYTIIRIGITSEYRSAVLRLLHDLPHAPMATNKEVLILIEKNTLMELGIGCIDAHLLAATLLAHGSRIWTRDKRLHLVADDLNLSYSPAGN